MSRHEATVSEIAPNYLALKRYFSKSQNEYAPYFLGIRTTITRFLKNDLGNGNDEPIEEQNMEVTERSESGAEPSMSATRRCVSKKDQMNRDYLKKK